MRYRNLLADGLLDINMLSFSVANHAVYSRHPGGVQDRYERKLLSVPIKAGDDGLREVNYSLLRHCLGH